MKFFCWSSLLFVSLFISEVISTESNEALMSDLTSKEDIDQPEKEEIVPSAKEAITQPAKEEISEEAKQAITQREKGEISDEAKHQVPEQADKLLKTDSPVTPTQNTPVQATSQKKQNEYYKIDFNNKLVNPDSDDYFKYHYYYNAGDNKLYEALRKLNMNLNAPKQYRNPAARVQDPKKGEGVEVQPKSFMEQVATLGEVQASVEGTVNPDAIVGSSLYEQQVEMAYNQGPHISSPELLLSLYEREITPVCRDFQYANHDFLTDVDNLSKANLRAEMISRYQGMKGKFWRILKYANFMNNSIANPLINKQLKLIKDQVGLGALMYSQNQGMQISKLYLEETYRESFIPSFSNRLESLHIQEIEYILKNPNTSYNEKLYYWKNWYQKTDNISLHVNTVVNQYITIAAKNQGFKEGSELLKRPYENYNIDRDMQRLWNDVEPLYTLLRKHVQRILKEKYGSTYTHSGWSLPAHLAGSTTGGDWTHVYLDALPYPCESGMSSQTILNFVDYCSASQVFRRSMGMTSNTIDCRALFDARTYNFSGADCRSKTYDFCDGISYITFICDNQPADFDLGIELEKMFYAMEYHDMPLILRGAHPVIKDAISYLMTTQVYRFGTRSKNSDEASINQLMYEALYFLPKIAYAMSLTSYQWRRASSEVVYEGWNSLWWNLRYQYEGIDKPEGFVSGAYDPAGNYDIVMGNDKTSDIFSPFVFYQMLKGFCVNRKGIYNMEFRSKHETVCHRRDQKISHKSRDLYECSLVGREDVGSWIRFVQTQGAAVDWHQILQEATGSRELSSEALLTYFEPLKEFLYEEEYESQRGLWILLWFVIALLILIVIILLIIWCIRRRRNRGKFFINEENAQSQQSEIPTIEVQHTKLPQVEQQTLQPCVPVQECL